MKHAIVVTVLGVMLSAALCQAATIAVDYSYTITFETSGEGSATFMAADTTGNILNDGKVLGRREDGAATGDYVKVSMFTPVKMLVNIDLGAVYTLSQVRIHTVVGRADSGTAAPHIVDVNASGNGTDWVDVGNWTNPVLVVYGSGDPNNSPYNSNFAWQSTGEVTGITARYVTVAMENLLRDNNNKHIVIDEVEVLAVPEPGTIALSLAGAGLMIRRKRRRN